LSLRPSIEISAGYGIINQIDHLDLSNIGSQDRRAIAATSVHDLIVS